MERERFFGAVPSRLVAEVNIQMPAETASGGGETRQFDRIRDRFPWLFHTLGRGRTRPPTKKISNFARAVLSRRPSKQTTPLFGDHDV
jgi:hypothetical protein